MPSKMIWSAQRAARRSSLLRTVQVSNGRPKKRARDERRHGGQILRRIGDEMRAGAPGVQQKRHAQFLAPAARDPTPVRIVPLGDDAAREVAAQSRGPPRLRRDRTTSPPPARNSRQHVGGALRRAGIAVEVAFELEQQRRAAGDQIAQFAKRQDAVGASP